jgi:hypothetical protein
MVFPITKKAISQAKAKIKEKGKTEMKHSFKVGDRITLSDSMRAACGNDQRYAHGIITRIGYWNIVDVKFCGISQDIGMRSDELVTCK